MFNMQADQIGGAIVRRTFKSHGKQLVSGTHLSAEEVLAFATANRNALVDKRFIDLYPKSGAVNAPAGQAERFVVSAGFGRFHVIEGRKLNDESIDREQAYALAGQEAPPKVARRQKTNQ